MSLLSLASTAAVTVTFYAVPRVMQYINTSFLPQRAQDFLSSDRVKAIFAAFKDNLWISFLILQSFTQANITTLFCITNLSNTILSLSKGCILLFIIRTMAARQFPSIAQYVGPSFYPI